MEDSNDQQVVPGHSGGGRNPNLKSRNNSREISVGSQKDMSYYIEFGERLGFSLDQIQMAINRLNSENGNEVGSDSVEDLSEDKLLKELLLIGNTQQQKTDLSPNFFNNSKQLEVPSFNFEPIYVNNNPETISGKNLRPIIVDGSNIAMCHGLNEEFSVKGIEIAVDWFLQRGHEDITVFVPEDKRPYFSQLKDAGTAATYEYLIKDNFVKFTPCIQKRSPPPHGSLGSTSSTEVNLNVNSKSSSSVFYEGHTGGVSPQAMTVDQQDEVKVGQKTGSSSKSIKCYDDRFILRLAAETNGIVLSNDNFRDIMFENWEFRRVVENRLLMYTFVKDRIMIPDDPKGRHGPSIDQFLSLTPLSPNSSSNKKRLICPYGRNCTYGVKCKFSHSLEMENYEGSTHQITSRQNSSNRNRNQQNKNTVKQVHSVPIYHNNNTTTGGGSGNSSNFIVGRNRSGSNNSPINSTNNSYNNLLGAGTNHKVALRTKSDCISSSSSTSQSQSQFSPQGSFEEYESGKKNRAHKSISSSSNSSVGSASGVGGVGSGKRKLERKLAVYCSLSGDNEVTLGLDSSDSGINSNTISRTNSAGSSSCSPPKSEPKNSITSSSDDDDLHSTLQQGLDTHQAHVFLQEIQSNSVKKDIYDKVSAIFPSEQVLIVMKNCPQETDPKMLCKYLISKYWK